MIDSLDLVLRQTITSAVPGLVNRVGFQPPDEAWRQRVGAGSGVWLNCALVDLREDRARRSTEIRLERDPLRRVHAPFQLRCHYLLSAWNSAKDSAAVPASMHEHALLGRVVAALLQTGALVPSHVLLPAELSTLPTAWRESAFELDILPPEGFGKIPEYWGTMGRGTPWRPVVWLAVTVSVAPEPTAVDGIVLTILTSVGAGGGARDTVLTVGGSVADAAGPVADALVLLADPSGRLVARSETDGVGRFVLAGIVPGDYTVTARTAAHPAAASAAVTLPVAVGGELTLTFP